MTVNYQIDLFFFDGPEMVNITEAQFRNGGHTFLPTQKSVLVSGLGDRFGIKLSYSFVDGIGEKLEFLCKIGW